jgi:UDP-glucose-4-epimerase GalE
MAGTPGASRGERGHSGARQKKHFGRREADPRLLNPTGSQHGFGITGGWSIDQMKNILVTGGAGFIGSHTCKALERAGYLPITYDDLSRGHASAVRFGPLEVGDIADGERLAAVIYRYRPAAVIHFAGYGYVGESLESPDLYYGNNVIRSGLMLETLRRCGLVHVVFSSSCATYGGAHDRTIDETVEQKPLSTYGFSKLVIERMLADYARAFSFRSLALRYFNAAGADPEGELGECHDPEPHFIPRVLRVAAKMEPTIEINGTDYPTIDGTCVRDYVHVHDLAKGHVLALQAVLDGGIVGAINLGTGRGSSLLEIVRIAEQITKCQIAVKFGPRRVGDPASAIADASRAAQLLLWTPTYRDINQILEHAWKWLLGQFDKNHGASSPFTIALASPP